MLSNFMFSKVCKTRFEFQINQIIVRSNAKKYPINSIGLRMLDKIQNYAITFKTFSLRLLERNVLILRNKKENNRIKHITEKLQNLQSHNLIFFTSLFLPVTLLFDCHKGKSFECYFKSFLILKRFEPFKQYCRCLQTEVLMVHEYNIIFKNKTSFTLLGFCSTRLK